MASGGYRPGAGRKSMDPDEKRVQVTLTVAPETREKIQEMRRRGVQVGRILDEHIDNLARDY